jgi:N-acyl-D-aspartate/D-glutamate deacylase
MSYDVIIRGGTVMDGSGSPAGTADIAVQDGLITEVGRIDGAARRTRRHGLTVTPGFVAVHTHFDGQATWDPQILLSGRRSQWCLYCRRVQGT